MKKTSMKNFKPTISICIPTYEMHGKGAGFLAYSFDILKKQTYQPYEVVISDHSQNDNIKNTCEAYADSLNILYLRNTNKPGNSSANTNNAIKNASGDIIKILFQDDFLYDEHSLEQIASGFDMSADNWMVTASEHSIDGEHFYRPFYPKYNNKIHIGENTISSPSTLTVKNDAPLLFDENLIWLMDCDYYKRCYDAFGEPKILNSITVVNRVGPHQMSSGKLTGKDLRGKEYVYILKKYKEEELLKKHEGRQMSKKVKLTPKIFAQKAIRRLFLYLKKTWRYLFLKRKCRYILSYLYYDTIKTFYKNTKKSSSYLQIPENGKKILLIYSKNHFNPDDDNPQKKLSANSAANLARNIYNILVNKDNEVTYVDQSEYDKNHGQFDMIMGIVCKNFQKYSSDNPEAEKVLFLVNSHPLYRLKALLKESKYHKKPIPLGEYVSPLTFLKASKVSDKLIMIGNEFVRNTYVEYGLDKSQIKLINSGVNAETLIPKREFYSKDTTKIIFVASDIGIRKGFFRVMEVWEELNKINGIKIELAIVGGTKSFTEDINRFESRYNNVKNWGWIDSTDPVYKTLLQSSQIVINFSVEEGQVGCVLEAMACGCIPVITEESGIPITNMKDGIMIENGKYNPREISERIADLIKDRQKMINMSENTREYILKNHSWDTFKENFIKAIWEK